MKDFSPAMREIAGVVEGRVRERFKDGKGPDGARWRPSRRALDEGGQTLVDTGRLRDSITSASDARSAIVGTNVLYAAIHQEGGTIKAKGRASGGASALRTPFGPRGSVNMPARPFLGFAADEADEIRDVLAVYIQGQVLGGAA